ncbi:uncharacterized protein MONOS_2489 [Monocercomonoides exilis]|uniref:uncharacterized protein n=1 Tax=Monocercomonoides exilis TaxID=2049356 RepID=UPI00355A38B3|nr:hypothetical protein MONOS_2489 [Monocercomonoides exilis]|eukprot:MONOS_2489.1-p1 / transcript=MONOS_2489.1 / gene=MONOS_2489 / organism=Monocercomonoides_exilis_PA203 / gene_product=unspecified product / transcript_product=unspecified product / location=Mono_scaffold00051:162619-165017(-) / protein_length=760 / sequence_SO=supercontig / SO=protein_coding / is_pseudo=false
MKHYDKKENINNFNSTNALEQDVYGAVQLNSSLSDSMFSSCAGESSITALYRSSSKGKYTVELKPSHSISSSLSMPHNPSSQTYKSIGLSSSPFLFDASENTKMKTSIQFPNCNSHFAFNDCLTEIPTNKLPSRLRKKYLETVVDKELFKEKLDDFQTIRDDEKIYEPRKFVNESREYVASFSAQIKESLAQRMKIEKLIKNQPHEQNEENDSLQSSNDNSISDENSDRLSSQSQISDSEQFDQLLFENFSKWRPPLNRIREFVPDVDFRMEGEKRSMLMRVTLTEMLKRWTNMDLKAQSHTTQLPSLLYKENVKNNSGEGEEMEDNVEEEEEEAKELSREKTNSEMKKMVKERSDKRKIIKEEIREATEFWSIFGIWVRKPWISSASERRIWEEAEKKLETKEKAIESRNISQLTENETIEEMKILLKEKEEAGAEEEELAKLRLQIEEGKRKLEKETRLNGMSDVERYTEHIHGTLQKRQLEHLKNSGSHCEKLKEEEEEEEEREEEEKEVDFINSFNSKMNALPKYSVFDSYSHDLFDDTFLESHQMTEQQDSYNKHSLPQHLNSESHLSYNSSNLSISKSDFSSSAHESSSYLLPQSADSRLLHNRPLANVYESSSFIQKEDTYEDSDAPMLSSSSSDSSEANENVTVISFCFEAHLPQQENKSIFQQILNKKKEKYHKTISTVRHRCLLPTPPQRKFLWSFDEMEVSLKRRWKSWFQTQGKWKRSATKEELESLYYEMHSVDKKSDLEIPLFGR